MTTVGGEVIITYDTSRPRDPMPSLGAIFLHWFDRDFAELKTQRLRDVTDPWCFRCGWLAPTVFARTREKNPDLTGTAMVGAAWDDAHGWLTRCHLWDHAEGGPETADNLVPMCCACHRVQPPCGSREDGISYVNENVECPPLLREFTDIFRGKPRGYTRRDVMFWIGVSNHYEAKYKAIAASLAAGEQPSLLLPDPDSPSYNWPLSREAAQTSEARTEAKRQERAKRAAALDAAMDALRDGHV